MYAWIVSSGLPAPLPTCLLGFCRWMARRPVKGSFSEKTRPASFSTNSSRNPGLQLPTSTPFSSILSRCQLYFQVALRWAPAPLPVWGSDLVPCPGWTSPAVSPSLPSHPVCSSSRTAGTSCPQRIHFQISGWFPKEWQVLTLTSSLLTYSKI